MEKLAEDNTKRLYLTFNLISYYGIRLNWLNLMCVFFFLRVSLLWFEAHNVRSTSLKCTLYKLKIQYTVLTRKTCMKPAEEFTVLPSFIIISVPKCMMRLNLAHYLHLCSCQKTMSRMQSYINPQKTFTPLNLTNMGESYLSTTCTGHIYHKKIFYFCLDFKLLHYTY